MYSVRSVTALGLLLLSFLFFVGTPVSAQIGTDPSFKLYVGQVDPTGLVRIKWTTPSSGDITMYYVYRATIPFRDSSSFAAVGSTQGNSFEDHLPNSNISTGVKYAYFVLAKRTNGMFLASNTVTVEVPGIPPQNAFRLEAKLEDGKVNLAWRRPAVALSTPFSVYRITLLSMISPTYPTIGGDTLLLTTTNDTFYVDIPPAATAGMKFYAYFVTAKTADNIPIQSSLAFVTIRGSMPHDEVKFISRPVLTASVGVRYVYDANAVSSDPTTVIRYSVESPISSVFIECDSVTGVITFTADHKLIIPMHVIALSSRGGRATQEFEVNVGSANGIISGKVTDTLDRPIKGVLIDVLKRDARNSFSYKAVTDSLGKYRIVHIDVGTYYVHAIPVKGDYLDQWYDGKQSAADANPVIVADSPSVAVADFKLRSKSAVILPFFTVSGNVSDTLGLPISIPGTQVVFVNVDFAFNAPSMRPHLEMDHEIDFHLEGNSRFVFKSGVDSLGAYSMKIPAGAYIAFAKAPGYSREFYKQKSYVLIADIIKLTADSSGIDFTLSTLPPVPLGSISGRVLDSVNNVGVRARLIAFREPLLMPPVRIEKFFIRAFFTETDSLGSYSFSDLPPGFYYVLGLPVGNYAPVFYTNGSPNMRWEKASRIFVNGNSVVGINLYPTPLPDSSHGYTLIKGSVNLSGGGVKAFGGVMVFASYGNGKIAGYAFTDGQGNFAIEELAPGSYTVFADVPGYSLVSSAQTSPSYDAMGNAVAGSVTLVLSPTSVQSVAKALPAEYILNQNYPNPFNPSTTIRYSIPTAGRVSLRIYNILGQLVATLVDGYQNAGTYQASFDGSALSSGVYLYRIEAGSFATVKKMLLVK